MGLRDVVSRRRLHMAFEDYVLTRPSPLFRPAFRLDEGQERAAATAVVQLRAAGAFMAGPARSASQ